MDEIIQLNRKLAVLEERSRIMSEIDLAELPFGVWLLIRNIIIPEGE